MVNPGCPTALYTIPVVVHVVHNDPTNMPNPSSVSASTVLTNNISDEQVISQIEVLNEDFRKLNFDLLPTSPYYNRAGDARIEFALADFDPSGNPTNGINRHYTSSPDFAKIPNSSGTDCISSHSMKSSNPNSSSNNSCSSYTPSPPNPNCVPNTTTDGVYPWDNLIYLNIWVTNINPSPLCSNTTSCPPPCNTGCTSTTPPINCSVGQLGGFAFYPPSVYMANSQQSIICRDGIVVDHRAFGTNGTAGGNNTGFCADLCFGVIGWGIGKTTTHEIGHFLGLRHLWGSSPIPCPNTCPCDMGTCSIGDDLIPDTPPQSRSTGNNLTSCTDPNSDPLCTTTTARMFNNFMDYSNCRNMFTRSQICRMHGFLTPGGYRHSLTEINIINVEVIHESCAGNDGRIKIITPMTRNQTYLWSHDNINNTPMATDLAAGTYTVTITNTSCEMEVKTITINDCMTSSCD